MANASSDNPSEPALAHESIYTASISGSSLRQAEILSDVIEFRLTLDSLQNRKEAAEVRPTKHPLAIIITQDCDLEQDFFARFPVAPRKVMAARFLPNILLCHVVTVPELMAITPPGSDIWNRVKQNKDERYHVLESVPASQDALGIGMPSMGIDFKRLLTIPTDEVYAQLEMQARRRCVLASPYLEHLSTRFAYFLLRVALPRPHEVS